MQAARFHDICPFCTTVVNIHAPVKIHAKVIPGSCHPFEKPAGDPANRFPGLSHLGAWMESEQRKLGTGFKTCRPLGNSPEPAGIASPRQEIIPLKRTLAGGV